MTPVGAETLDTPAGLPKTLEEGLIRYGSCMFKAPALTILDASGKSNTTVTYGKLLSRARKIAFHLLNRVSQKGEVRLKPGDRLALIYPNEDAISFVSAFYGCLMAGVVPVPIEVPINKDDASSMQIGFLLGTSNISYAMTSDIHKNIYRTPSGEPQRYRGWPEITWLFSNNLTKPSKDWNPPPRVSEDQAAYIEYTSESQEGSMKGVTVSRRAMISHCKSLSSACRYTEGETMICVLDFKREAGLWHAVQVSVLNGMHVIFVPYASMKLNPATWMLTTTKTKATIAICKSRDLHWGLLSSKNMKDINLSSLRIIVVADGANPWSLSSCDQFSSVFLNRGLRQDAICPCAISPEALTVAIRRPGHTGNVSTGRGILSMSALSHGVIRVDQESNPNSLCIQDCGNILPNSYAAVAKISDTTQLCKTDEVGEILLSSVAVASCYWGLPGLTNSRFRQQIIQDGAVMYQNQSYVRTGLLGFIGPGSLVFICGTRDGLMQVTGRRHNTDDIIATILSVEPMRFVYRGRIAVFSITVLRDERICVVAEQRPGCTEDESFNWMSKVLAAIDCIHSFGVYCLALVLPNQLPKTILGGIHLSEVRKKFMEGSLHPANVLMCPYTTVTNLPKERQLCHADVGPASIMVGKIVQGVNLAVATGPTLHQESVLPSATPDDSVAGGIANPYYISEILKWRHLTSPDHNLFTLLNSKNHETITLTCSQLHKRAERIGAYLIEKSRLNSGDHVALIYPPGLDLICAFYGCLYVGVVPVTIRPPHAHNLHSTLPTAKMVVDVSKSVLTLTTSQVAKLLRSREAALVIDMRTWVPIVETDELPKKKLSKIYQFLSSDSVAYLDFSVSTTGMLTGVKITQGSLISLCRSMKLACELYPSRHLALAIDPYSGLGFVLWCVSGIHSGHHTFLTPPAEVEQNPALWFSAISANKVRDTFCSYSVMEVCTRGMTSSITTLRQRGINLNCVRTCVVVAEERPRIQLISSFSKLFSSLGLSPRSITTSFGCRSNIAICLQGSASPDTKRVYVDMRALRHDRVTFVEKGSPHSLCLIQSGKLMPGTRIVIANPETKGHCGESNLGEIWIHSPYNSNAYFSSLGQESEDVRELFDQRLITADTSSAKYTYARTGFLGFLRKYEDIPSAHSSTSCPNTRTDLDNSNISQGLRSNNSMASNSSISPEGYDQYAVFIVGSLDETLMLRGLRYHPIDIETSIMRCHQKIADSAVFEWNNHLVVVVELDGDDNEALDVVPLVTNIVLEEHHLIVGVVVIVDLRVVPINSRGEKQRMHLKDRFLADQLDPIYVAYNM